MCLVGECYIYKYVSLCKFGTLSQLITVKNSSGSCYLFKLYHIVVLQHCKQTTIWAICSFYQLAGIIARQLSAGLSVMLSSESQLLGLNLGSLYFYAPTSHYTNIKGKLKTCLSLQTILGKTAPECDRWCSP